MLSDSASATESVIRAAVGDALKSLLNHHGLSRKALANLLSEQAIERDLRGKDKEEAVKYDPAMIARWLSGSLAMSRQAAWLLDELYPNAVGEADFQAMRDRYILAHDRSQVPGPARGDDGAFAQDGADRRFPRRELPLDDTEAMAFACYSVVDCEQARSIIGEVTATATGVRAVAMYEVMGHWDLAVKFAIPAGFDIVPFHQRVHEELVANGMAGASQSATGELSEFIEHRIVTTDRTRIHRAGSDERPEFLVLDSAEDYDELRLQRTFLFVELRALSDVGRKAAQRSVRRLLDVEIPHSWQEIIEAVTVSDDAMIVEIIMSSDQSPYLHRLNRQLGQALTRFKAQKTNLLVFTTDESGWLEHCSLTR